MSEKLQILQCLIENKILAASASSLSMELGYKGKMGIYRLLRGLVSEKFINEIWDKILNKYNLEDNVLYDLANICILTKDFSNFVTKEMNTNHPKWVENVIMAVTDSIYDYFSDEFKKNTAPVLIDLRRDDPDILWGILTLFYIRTKNIEVYSKNNISIICNILNEFDQLLFSIHPENINAHQAADNLITMLKFNDKSVNIWTLIFNSIILFRYYTDTDFIKTVAQGSVIFNWPSRSYWIVPDTTYQKGAEFWLLVQNNFNTANNGIYIAVNVAAGKNTEEFIPQSTYIMQFMFPENILFVTRMNGEHKEICFYKYEYDSNLKTLKFKPTSDINNWCNLPDILYRLESSSLNGMSEKVWWRILEKFDTGGIGRDTYQKAIEKFTGVSDLSNMYKIHDVNISRTMLSIKLTVSDEKQQYQIPITNYSFLTKINPSESIIITRHELDNEIYVEWPNLGYAIKLSEWEKL